MGTSFAGFDSTALPSWAKTTQQAVQGGAIAKMNALSTALGGSGDALKDVVNGIKNLTGTAPQVSAPGANTSGAGGATTGGKGVAVANSLPGASGADVAGGSAAGAGVGGTLTAPTNAGVGTAWSGMGPAPAASGVKSVAQACFG